MSSSDIEMHANEPGQDGSGKENPGDGMPFEVVVHGGSSSGPSSRRSQSTSNITELPKVGDGGAPRDGIDDGEPREGKQMIKLSKSQFMIEFRTALNDPDKLDRLLAQLENHPVDAWSKALMWASSSGHEMVIASFMKRAPPNLKRLLKCTEDRDGFTMLHRAVVAGKKEVVKLLTRHGQDTAAKYDILHARTPQGWTSLHLAVANGDEDMTELLIKSYDLIPTPLRSEWDFADNFWMTPLHYAVLGNHVQVIKQLLQWRAYDRHVNAHDYYMRTPLHMAACRADASIKTLESCVDTSIKTLVNSRRVDVNAVDCCSYTPLHWAVYVGATDVVKFLISLAGERTIRTTEEDFEGRPVFQIAIENRMVDHKVCRDIEKLLLTCAEVKDEVERLYRDRQVYVDAANAILVGAALIASVTFGGWLQPPIGDNSRQTHRQLRVFWAANSLSFFFSIATVMAGGAAVLPAEHVYIGRAVAMIHRALVITSSLLIVSVVLVLVAFGASGFSSLSSFPNLKSNMIVTTCIGTAVCTTILTWFLHRLYKVGPDWTQYEQLLVIWHRLMTKTKQGRGLVEIEKELEDAEKKAREEIHKKYGNSTTVKKLEDLTGLAVALKGASKKVSQMRKQTNDRGLHNGTSDKEGGPGIREIHQHVKQNKLEQQILAFEEVYERARMLKTESGHVRDTSFNMLVLSHLGDRGIHYWINNLPVSSCRANSIKKDAERWARIYEHLFRYKSKLQEESTKFDYGILAFDDWSI